MLFLSKHSGAGGGKLFFFQGTFFLTLISVFEHSFFGESNLVNSVLCLEERLSCLFLFSSEDLGKSLVVVSMFFLVEESFMYQRMCLT